MATKKISPELRVVFDSNVIYAQSERFLLRHEVAEFIRANSSHADLKVVWYLPEVVRHERQFQMLRRALELLPSIQKLERLLGHNLNITEQIVTKRVAEAVDEQIRELGLMLLQFDATTIDWAAMMQNAAYRKPPFSATEKEKGFRDALIAEAFMQVVESSPMTAKICRVVLVTGDDLLTKAVQERASTRTNVRILPSIEELKSLIDTLVSEVSEDFIQQVKERAEKYFHDPNSTESLYAKEGVWEKVREQFGDALSALPTGADGRDLVKARLGAPRFSRKERQRVFWISRLSVEMNAYRYEQVESGLESWRTIEHYLPATFQKTFPNLSRFMNETDVAAGYQLPLSKYSQQLGTSMSSEIPITTLPARRAKSYLMSGTIEFDITWSVSISTARHSLSAGRIETIDHVGTTWGAGA
jgi:hypothetical protein